MQIESKVALVTGVSSGIGRETAALLVERGYRVFGTVRNLDAASVDGLELIRMDVTSPVMVTEVCQSVLRRAGHIDALVNNAGYALVGAIEETTIAEARELFDTNFFGVLRVTQEVLPAMRRQGFGRIVNISSVLGFLPMPYMGIYAATKHALEAYTETLDHEVRRLGIRATLVEPGWTNTSLGANERKTVGPLSDYAAERAHMAEVIESRIASGSEPRAVAEAVYRALSSERPRLRYSLGEGVLLSVLRRYVPASMFDWTFRKQFQLDPPGGTRPATLDTVPDKRNP